MWWLIHIINFFPIFFFSSFLQQKVANKLWFLLFQITYCGFWCVIENCFTIFFELTEKNVIFVVMKNTSRNHINSMAITYNSYIYIYKTKRSYTSNTQYKKKTLAVYKRVNRLLAAWINYSKFEFFVKY